MVSTFPQKVFLIYLFSRTNISQNIKKKNLHYVDDACEKKTTIQTTRKPEGVSLVQSLVKKVVIPAAGFGTRLKPLTQFIPKELLPIGDKPMLQHMMEMYLDAGMTEFCIITNPHKPEIREFVTGNYRSAGLPYKPNPAFYRRLKSCKICFITQPEPKGVADAISLAGEFVGNEPFGCIMPDCLLFSDTPFFSQLTDSFSNYRKNIIGTVRINPTEAKRYGNVGLLQTIPLDDRCFSIRALSGKSDTPLQVPLGQQIQKGFGGGIYLPEYFDLIDVIRPDAKGEIDDVPIHHILINENNLLGVPLEGKSFDTGHPFGFRAAVHYAGRPDWYVT